MKLWRLCWGALIIFTVASNFWNCYCIRKLSIQQKQIVEELPRFVYQLIKDEANQ